MYEVYNMVHRWQTLAVQLQSKLDRINLSRTFFSFKANERPRFCFSLFFSCSCSLCWLLWPVWSSASISNSRKSYSGLECWARNLIRLEFKPLFLSGLKLFGENQKSLKNLVSEDFLKEQTYLICYGGLVVSSPNSCQSELSSTPPLTWWEKSKMKL